MEMLFLTAQPSLLWPDGIRECSEAVKTNIRKKRRRGEEEMGMGGGKRMEGQRKRERQEWKVVSFLHLLSTERSKRKQLLKKHT